MRSGDKSGKPIRRDEDGEPTNCELPGAGPEGWRRSGAWEPVAAEPPSAWKAAAGVGQQRAVGGGEPQGLGRGKLGRGQRGSEAWAEFRGT